MRVGAPSSTRVIVGPAGQIIQSLPVQTRLAGIAVAPPPPPPYPGPPPPYPGQQVIEQNKHLLVKHNDLKFSFELISEKIHMIV